MTYTNNLIKLGINHIVPFADKIPGMNKYSPPEISKTQEKRRQRTSRAMQQAIKAGQLDTSYTKIVNSMHQNATAKLDDATYTTTHYLSNQIGKLEILDHIIPGAGILPKAIAKAGNTHKLLRCVTQESNTKQKILNITKMALPLIAGVTQSLWKPVVTALIPKEAVIAAAAVAVGTVLAIDAINYSKK